jgi:hypothetical protein
MGETFFFSEKMRPVKGVRGRTAQQLADLLPLYSHADYVEWREIWRGIRHAMLGEPAIKRQREQYLPATDGMDTDQYAAYLDRAVFFNMTSRTVTGMTGAIFRRAPRLLNAGAKTLKMANSISKDGLSLSILAKVVSQEQLSVGRVGLLLDKADETTGSPTATPYLALYTAENILDWTVVEIEGRFEPDYILLREFFVDRRPTITKKVGRGAVVETNYAYGQLFIRLRILRLVYNEADNRWEYQQELYERENGDADLSVEPVVTQPQIYGKPFSSIPFRFFNPTTSLTGVEKPPVLDILTLNLSHYKTYAQLEQGRFYTANPVYFVNSAEESDEYHIGPGLVWALDMNGKAGIIEYNGTGLKSLEKALETKETQVAALGGRLIGDSTSAGQSDNQTKLKDRNEQSLLLNVTTVLNENFTELIRMASEWMNEQTPNVEFRVNQDFLLSNFSAREFRAITLMWQEGLLPLDVIYEFFLQYEVIPEFITIDVFKELLQDEDQWIHNPDVIAKQAGFPDATAKLQHSEFEEELALQKSEQDFNEKQATKIPVVPAQATQANLKDPSSTSPPSVSKPNGKTKLKPPKP